MEDNNQYDDLLVKYLAGEASAEERQTVEDWINASKVNQEYFDHFQNTWRLLGAKAMLAYVDHEMDINSKWDQFKERIRIVREPLTANQLPKTRLVTRLIRVVAVAASLVAVILLGYKLMVHDPKPVIVAAQSATRYDSSIVKVVHEINTTGRNKAITLPDGSVVIMASKSEIFYNNIFLTRRDITLSGKAYFKVVKDARRPFTVFSGSVSTTALGTEFTVTAYKNARQLKVRLFEGKVVVKAIDKTNKKMKSDVYLLPGQEFIYSEQVIAKVGKFRLQTNATPNQKLADVYDADQPSVPQDRNGSWYMFNNESLEKVLDDLAGMYNKKIHYNKKDVQLIYFTGKYNKSDSLETILAGIGKLNNLHIIKSDTAYTITK